MRISLNDNLLNRCSLAEIESVMGHEIGPLRPQPRVQVDALLRGRDRDRLRASEVGLREGHGAAGARAGASGAWATRGPAPGARLLSAYFFVLTPLLNSWIRMEEAEADLFGINASGQPDGEARVDLMLGEYRKLDPSPLEEALFFDHPSGRSRILMAMKWKAEHLAEAQANASRAAEDDRRRGWSPETAEAWAAAHAPGHP